MSLKIFTPSNCVSVKKRMPRLSIAKSNGAISLNHTLIQLLGVNDLESEGVVLFQDWENPTDWYVAKYANGFKLRKKNDDASATYIFSSSALSKVVQESFEKQEESLVFKVGEEATEVDLEDFGILLAYPLLHIA